MHSCAATVSEACTIVTVCAAIDLILERGIHDTAPHAFAQLGYLAAWRFNDFESGFRFGQLGYELIERRGLSRFEGLVLLERLDFGDAVGTTRHTMSVGDPSNLRSRS